LAATYGPLIGEMTWTELRDAIGAGYGVILPIGATEQHGPHLPLTTDCLLPVAVAKGAAARTRTLVATPVYYGCVSKPLSGGGQSFPGTTSIRGSTLIAIVKDLVGEFIRSGFENIILLTWHMENRGFVYEGADLAMRESAPTSARIMSIDSIMEAIDKRLIERMFPEDFPGWDVEHASIIETSMMLALYPELVRRDKIADDAAKRHPPYDMIPAPEDTIPKSGVLYRASLGTADNGRQLYDLAVEALVKAITTEFGNEAVL
jgi:creatinine amidohydrolase